MHSKIGILIINFSLIYIANAHPVNEDGIKHLGITDAEILLNLNSNVSEHDESIREKRQYSHNHPGSYGHHNYISQQLQNNNAGNHGNRPGSGHVNKPVMSIYKPGLGNGNHYSHGNRPPSGHGNKPVMPIYVPGLGNGSGNSYGNKPVKPIYVPGLGNGSGNSYGNKPVYGHRPGYGHGLGNGYYGVNIHYPNNPKPFP